MKVVALLVLILLAFGFSSSGQNIVAPNQFLSEVYSSAELSQLTPDRIEYLNYLTEHGWEIMDIPTEKQNTLQDYPFLYKIDRETKMALQTYLDCAGLQHFNLLTYDYVIKKERGYYKVAGCSKLLIIKSHSEITEGFNEYRKL